MNKKQIDAQQLRRKGVPITTFDGRELRLVFDFTGMVEIERYFGSVGGMQDVLTAIQRDGLTGHFFTPVLNMVRAGLAHDPEAADATFDVALIQDYLTAVMKALELAFPKDKTRPTTASPPVDAVSA